MNQANYWQPPKWALVHVFHTLLMRNSSLSLTDERQITLLSHSFAPSRALSLMYVRPHSIVVLLTHSLTHSPTLANSPLCLSLQSVSFLKSYQSHFSFYRIQIELRLKNMHPMKLPLLLPSCELNKYKYSFKGGTQQRAKDPLLSWSKCIFRKYIQLEAAGLHSHPWNVSR